MIIERNANEVIFRLPSDIDTSGLQHIVNYLKYKEIMRQSDGNENQANTLANESKSRWWKENKDKFIK